jgi:hypothetical protein
MSQPYRPTGPVTGIALSYRLCKVEMFVVWDRVVQIGGARVRAVRVHNHSPANSTERTVQSADEVVSLSV